MSRPNENCSLVLPVATTMSSSDGRSYVVKVLPHEGHRLRRHTWADFLCGRELGVKVLLCKQYIQIMSIYCHIAIKNTSGKHNYDSG